MKSLFLSKKKSELIDFGFQISMIAKGLDGLLEIIGGLVLTIVPIKIMDRVLIAMTRQEILEDPHDLIANYLLKIAHNLSIRTVDFTIAFLLIHGIVKLFLVIFLIKKKHWAYPAAIIVFSLFGVYQIYQYFLNHSVGLLLLTILDAIAIILTYLEFILIKRKHRQIEKI